MSPERWERIKGVAFSAMEREGETRARFLDEACGTDSDLRRAVEELLEEDQRAGGTLVGAIEAVAAEIRGQSEQASLAMVGQTISHYRIIDKLGQGGMGVVYKAKDTRLKRAVALKFLAAHLLRDEGCRRRFEREATVAATLDHPNICRVYEIGEADGKNFIAMAFIEGQGLDERIAAGPLKLNKALDIARQAADGLQEAHSHGIVHRDVKPANVMVTLKGGSKEQVTLMDFGLAQLAGHSKLTRLGETMGTIAYMSPEQTMGAEVDHRTDMWSLGVVLYEMVTGQRPFKGHYDKAVMYSITNEEPEPLTALRTGVPMELEFIVAKCLAKDADNRYQNAGDMAVDLKNLQERLNRVNDVKVAFQGTRERLEKTELARKRPPESRWRVAAGLACGLTVMIGLAWLLPSWLARSVQQPEVTLLSHDASAPSWSPDGEWVVYAAPRKEGGPLDLFKRRLIGGEEIPLTNSPHNEMHPAWSPDGRTIAFESDQRDGGGIAEITAEGGSEFHLIDGGTNPRWSSDGKKLAYEQHGAVFFWSRGEKPHQLLAGTGGSPVPVWSPNSQRLILWNRAKSDICVVAVTGSDCEPLGLVATGEEVSGLSWSQDGEWLIFSKGPNGGNKVLWSAQMDAATGKPRAKSARSLTISHGDEVVGAISPDGKRIAYTVQDVHWQLYRIPLDPKTGQDTGVPEKMNVGGHRNYYPEVSRDGQFLVWTAQTGAQGLIYTKHIGTGDEQRLTSVSDASNREIWASLSPDSPPKIAYSSTLGGSYALFLMSSLWNSGLKLTNTTTRIEDDKGQIRDSQPDWSWDGRSIAFFSTRSGNPEIWTTGSSGGDLTQITKWKSNEYYPAWSPDGRRLAFQSDRDGNPDIWVKDMEKKDDDDEKTFQVYVKDPAEEGPSAWSVDGRYFYFSSDRSGEFNIWMMLAEGGPAQPVTRFKRGALGLPESALYSKFAVSASHLIVPLESRSSHVCILDNWQGR